MLGVRVWRVSSRRAQHGQNHSQVLQNESNHHVGPLFVALAVVLLSCCIASFYDVVFPYHFRKQDTSWITFAAALAWTAYLVTMMVFHYYKSITVKPGSPLDPPAPPSRDWARFVPASLCVGALGRFAAPARVKPDPKRERMIKQIQADQHANKQNRHDLASAGQPASSMRREKKGRTCKKCDRVDGVRPPKPGSDSSCPWIKQCVGLHNERYFVLFLCYFSISCGFAAYWGWKPLWLALDFGQWPHRTPRMFVPLTFILALILGLAVAIMAIYQIWLIAGGETTVEAHDNGKRTDLGYACANENSDMRTKQNGIAKRQKCEEQSFAILTTWANRSDLPAVSDGWTWRKIPDWEKYAMRLEDELTDEEMASDGEQVVSREEF
ncbi:hypothetical protein OIV83_001657 [Microbotryomycetes sp. JL201]|nr:hypothetical protein OIV83_001657 [Microbotryomycetes sp. JL201]